MLLIAVLTEDTGHGQSMTIMKTINTELLTIAGTASQTEINTENNTIHIMIVIERDLPITTIASTILTPKATNFSDRPRIMTRGNNRK